MKAILDNSTIFFFNFIFLHEQILCETTQGHTISFFPPPFMLQQNKTKKKHFLFFLSLSLFLNHSNQTWCNRVSVSHIGIWSNRPST